MAFFDDGQLAFFIRVARPLRLNFVLKETAVDFKYDLEMTWKHTLEQRHTPLFQRLGKEGVVGVVKQLACDRPCRVPIETMHIDGKTHKFRNRNRRVRIVELNYVVGIKLTPVIMLTKVAADDILQRTTDEEVLLHETQLFTIFCVVVRIKHLGDRLSHCFFANRFDVAAVIENIEVKLLRCTGLPQA